MVNRRLLIILIGAALAIGAAFLLFRQDDRARIARQLREIEKRVNKTAGENELALAARIMGAGKFFMSPCRLVAPGLPGLSGEYSSRQVCENIVMLFATVRSVDLGFHDVVIAVTGTTATLNATIEGRGFSHAGERFTEARELVAHLVKEEGQWRFSDCELVDVVEK